jgi:catechol 2,3-dioxygenase-like lactoylglutathione lyase family enzyme
MKFRLHEIELNSKDPMASRAFYKDALGLEMNHGEDGLNVFDSGWAGIDFDTSLHTPGRTRIGFVVDSLAEFLAYAKEKGLVFAGPEDSHLGMRIVRLQDPDGNLVEVQELTEKTPGFLMKAHGT